MASEQDQTSGLDALAGEVNPETGKITWAEERRWTKLKQTSGPKKTSSQETDTQPEKRKAPAIKKPPTNWNALRKKEAELEFAWGTRSIWVKGDDGELRPSARFWPALTNKELMEVNLFCPCGMPFSKSVYPRNVIIYCARHAPQNAAQPTPQRQPPPQKPTTEQLAAQALVDLWKGPPAKNFLEFTNVQQQTPKQQAEQPLPRQQAREPRKKGVSILKQRTTQRQPEAHASTITIVQNGLCCEPEEPEPVVKILEDDIPDAVIEDNFVKPEVKPSHTLHYLGPKDVVKSSSNRSSSA